MLDKVPNPNAGGGNFVPYFMHRHMDWEANDDQ